MRKFAVAGLLALGLGLSTPALAGTTWNDLDCNVGVTLDITKTIATRTSVGWASCRSTTSKAFGNGNYVVKFHLASDSASPNQGIQVGFATAAANLGNYIGQDHFGFTRQMNAAAVFSAGAWCLTPTLCPGTGVGGISMGGPGTDFYLSISSAWEIHSSVDCVTWSLSPDITLDSSGAALFIATSLYAWNGGGTGGGTATTESATILPSAPGCTFPLTINGQIYKPWDLAGGQGGLLLRNLGN